MRCDKLKPYDPPGETFVNPYPDEQWSNVDDFVYETSLHLCRCIEAVQRREGEDADYIVSQSYTAKYSLDGQERKITVPEGMVTDLSSVPRVARSFIGRVGPHLEASIVHDFLYIAWQDVDGRSPREKDREFADKLMRAGMKSARVGATKRWLIYHAIRMFGKGAYDRTDKIRYMKDC